MRAREDGGEEQRRAIVWPGTLDLGHVLAAAREPAEARGAPLAFDGERERVIVGSRRAQQDGAHVRRSVGANAHCKACVVDERRRRALAFGGHEANLGREEPGGLFLQGTGLEARVEPLQEHPVRRGRSGARELRLTKDSVLIVEVGGFRHAVGQTRLPSCYVSAVLVDTHCHLDAHYFPEGPAQVMDRARAAGVHGFVVIGVGASLDAADAAVAIAHGHPDEVAATVGIHPHDASSCDAAAIERLTMLARDPAVVAVGEIGLDYHYDHSPRDVQRRAFAELVGVARAVKKPIVIHTREAAADTLEILAREGARDVGGLIHCFSEDWAFAEQALDLGFDISFSGIVTFKNAKAVQEVAAKAPADRILVETDSPYLAPIPYRGKPCEPAYVVHTAHKVAELRGIPFDDLARQTTENAERRFGRRFGRLA